MKLFPNFNRHHLIAHTYWCLFCNNSNDNDDDDESYGDDDDDGSITWGDLGVDRVDRGQPSYY